MQRHLLADRLHGEHRRCVVGEAEAVSAGLEDRRNVVGSERALEDGHFIQQTREIVVTPTALAQEQWPGGDADAVRAVRAPELHSCR